MEPLWTDDRIHKVAGELTDELDSDVYVYHLLGVAMTSVRDDYETEHAALTQRIAELERTIEQNDAVRADLWEHIRQLEARQPSTKMRESIRKLVLLVEINRDSADYYYDDTQAVRNWLDTLQEADRGETD